MGTTDPLTKKKNNPSADLTFKVLPRDPRKSGEAGATHVAKLGQCSPHFSGICPLPEKNHETIWWQPVVEGMYTVRFIDEPKDVTSVGEYDVQASADRGNYKTIGWVKIAVVVVIIIETVKLLIFVVSPCDGNVALRSRGSLPERAQAARGRHQMQREIDTL